MFVRHSVGVVVREQLHVANWHPPQPNRKDNLLSQRNEKDVSQVRCWIVSCYLYKSSEYNLIYNMYHK